MVPVEASIKAVDSIASAVFSSQSSTTAPGSIRRRAAATPSSTSVGSTVGYSGSSGIIRPPEARNRSRVSAGQARADNTRIGFATSCRMVATCRYRSMSASSDVLLMEQRAPCSSADTSTTVRSAVACGCTDRGPTDDASPRWTYRNGPTAMAPPQWPHRNGPTAMVHASDHGVHRSIPVTGRIPRPGRRGSTPPIRAPAGRSGGACSTSPTAPCRRR